MKALRPPLTTKELGAYCHISIKQLGSELIFQKIDSIKPHLSSNKLPTFFSRKAMKNYLCHGLKKHLGLFFTLINLIFPHFTYSQGIMEDDIAPSVARTAGFSRLINIEGRNTITLNGKWNFIIDPADFGIGSWAAIYKNQKPK